VVFASSQVPTSDTRAHLPAHRGEVAIAERVYSHTTTTTTTPAAATTTATTGGRTTGRTRNSVCVQETSEILFGC